MASVNLPYVIIAAAIFVAVVYHLANRKRVVRIEHTYFSRVWLCPPWFSHSLGSGARFEDARRR